MKKFLIFILLLTCNVALSQIGSIGGGKTLKVQNLNAALKSCAHANGYVDSVELNTILTLDCSNSNFINKSVNGIGGMKNLEVLNLSNNPLLTSLESFTKLQHLETLDLSTNQNMNLSTINSLVTLKILNLSQMNISSIPNLTPLIVLESLDLSNNSTLTNFANLPSGLTDLDLKSTNGFGRSYCAQIAATGEAHESLTISANQSNIEDCAGVNGLHYLFVDGGNFDSEVQNVSSFTNGICALTVRSTNLKQLNGQAQIIDGLRLSNNIALKKVEPFAYDVNGGLVLPMGLYITEDNSKLLCSNKFAIDAVPVYDPNPISKSAKNSPPNKTTVFCPNLAVIRAGIKETPEFCTPDELVSVTAIHDNNTQRTLVSWEKDINHDYVLWGITHYKVTGYDSGNNIVEVIDNIPVNDRLPVFSTATNVSKFSVSACTVDRCGYEIEAPVIVSSGLAVNTFDVYEDANTQRRFITWEKNVNYNFEYWGVNSFEIKGLLNGNVVYRRVVTVDATPNYLVSNSLKSDTYIISACTNDSCKQARSDTLFTQGLTRATDTDVFWNTTGQSPENFTYKIRFKYPNVAFNTLNGVGKPTYFKITPDFLQGSIADMGVTITVTDPNRNGNCEQSINGNDGSCNGDNEIWVSPLLSRNQFIGNNFTITACNDIIGCGAGASLNLGNPLTDSQLPVPQWDVWNQTIGTGTQIILDWNESLLNEKIPNTDIYLVDYLEVTEVQPVIPSNHPFGEVPSNNVTNVFYIDRGMGASFVGDERLSRVTKGSYYFTLKACHRDRDLGDTCSFNSTTVTKTLNRAEVSFPPTPTNINFVTYDDTTITRKALVWNKIIAPDYFYVSGYLDTAGLPGPFPPICSGGNEADSIKNVKNSVYSVSLNTGSNQEMVSSVVSCKDIANINHLTWTVQACYSGLGCGNTVGPIQSDTPAIGTIANPFTQSTTNSVGGPGDMNPGSWWNPLQAGTGWHFYWASELRYPSVHERYGKTYDLLGVWYTYKLIDDVWTPIWIFSHLKQTQDLGGTQFFEGSLNYFTRTGGVTNSRSIGRLQVRFGGAVGGTVGGTVGDNNIVLLNIDLDSENGLITQDIASTEIRDDCTTFPDYDGIDLCSHVEDNGTLNVPLINYDVTVQAQPGVFEQTGNNADHYSGLWWDERPDGTINEDYMFMIDVNKGLEWRGLIFYDNSGDPIWATSTNCVDNWCYPTQPGFKSMNFTTVPTGFNPLAYPPEGYLPYEVSIPVGSGSRALNSPQDLRKIKLGGTNLSITSAQLPSRGAGASLSIPANTILDKGTSFHDIRFFINGQDESVTDCYPNTNESGECVVEFTWFTDDDFVDIVPFYSIDGGSTYSELSLLCSGVPVGYVVQKFECTIPLENLSKNYKFQLRKPKYSGTGSGTVVIAESETMTIHGCTSQACTLAIGDPAIPPTIEATIGQIAADAKNDLVGTTSGVFDIDESGSANYSIPIFAPAGRGGLAPQLALSYNSGSGNGIAGVGWNISGTSSITRCLKSPEHDPGLTFYPRIQLDETDALCLDGQRLFKQADGSYRTEIDSFAKIVPVGTKGNGPASFTVYTKSGEIREYGSAEAQYKGEMFAAGTGAQIIANDTAATVHTWLLNKIEDRSMVTNSIHFVWDTFEGENYLSHVKWTNPNTDVSSNPTHHYQIDFEYTGSRTDAMHHYGIGTEYKAYRNLDHISTFIRETPTATSMQEVRRLNLNYESTANVTGMLRLSSIEQCLNASGTCLQPVEFEWDNGSTQVGFNSASFSSSHIGKMDQMGPGGFKPIDINGDGVKELIFVRNYDSGNWLIENQRARYYLAVHYTNQPGWDSCETQSGGYWNKICDLGIEPYDPTDNKIPFKDSSWFVYDFNGDGKDDLLTPLDSGPGPSTWHIYESNGSQLYAVKDTQIPYANVPSGDPLIRRNTASSILDVTNDGLPDLITPINDPTTTHLNYKFYKGYIDANNRLTFSNTNVDNKMLVLNENEFKYSCPGNTYGCSNSTTSTVIYDITSGVADFNGDGYPDTIVQYYQSFYATGCDPHRPKEEGWCWLNAYALAKYVPNNGTGNPELKFVKNLGITSRSHYNIGNIEIFGNSLRYMDINGDGLTDMVYKTFFDGGTAEYGYAYQLNTGKYDANNIVQFGDIHDFGTRTTNVLCNGDIDCINEKVANARLTQFIDYDLDGDVDILYPNPAPNGNSFKYMLSKFNNVTPYSTSEVEELNLTAWYNANDEEAREFVNVFMDFTGDGHPDYFQLYRDGVSNKKQRFHLGKGNDKPKNKITKITNELDDGNQQTAIEITYTPATDASVYEAQTGSFQLPSVGNGSPIFDIFSTMYLVSQVDKSSPSIDDPNGYTSVAYNYEGLKVQAGGRGSLGFAKITSYDPHHDVTTITQYHQDFPFIGMPQSTKTYYGAVTASNLLSESSSEYSDFTTDCDNDHICHFPYLARSIEKDYAFNAEIVNGLPVYSIETTAQKTIINKFTYNATDALHGNLTTSLTATCEGDATGLLDCNLVDKKESANTYTDDNSIWMLGRLTATHVTSTRNGQSKSKYSEFDYDGLTGQLIEERFYGADDLAVLDTEFLRTMHVYDDYGQEIETYQCSMDLSAIQCSTKPIVGRSLDANEIHRYKITSYDGVWNEYISHIFEPFTHYQDYILGNTLPTSLDIGGISEIITSNVVNELRDIYGNPLYSENHLGYFSQTVYGVFGQAHASATNTGGLSKTTTRWCTDSEVTLLDANCPNEAGLTASIVTIVEALGAPTKRSYVDVLGRTVRSQTQMFDGDWSTVDTYYDLLGRTTKQSEPYSRNQIGNSLATPNDLFTTTIYDPMDRVLKIQTPDHLFEDVITTTKYDGLSITTTNPELQAKTQLFDATGKVVSSTDADNGIVDYTYDANGNLVTTTSYFDSTDINTGITIAMFYDDLGRKTQMVDPDKGTWNYTYNALGELTTQTDAKGQITQNYYDIRGRLFYRNQPGVESVWEYDKNYEYGLLVNEYSVGQYLTDNIAQVVNYSYDYWSRPIEQTNTIYDGENVGVPKIYTTAQTYDQYGRAFQSFDATGNGVLYQYNNYGYQNIIRDAADGVGGQEYYEVKTTNARGQVIYEQYNNSFYTTKTYARNTGFLEEIITATDLDNALDFQVQNLSFTFDKIGNLTGRTDNTPGNGVSSDIYEETFTYDNRNRLEQEFLNNNSTNFYVYDETGNLLQKDGNTYHYGEAGHNAGPHAITTVSNNITSGYHYDNNGNVISRTGDNPATFVYTSFDKPNSITANGWVSEIAYNAGRSRYIRKDFLEGSASKKVTHYLGSVEYIYNNGRTKAKRYIGNLVITLENDIIDRNRWDYSYLLKDHIGSTHTIVNKNGQIQTHMSFNAWGQRRKQEYISGTASLDEYPISTTWALLQQDIEEHTNRGFTGHEHFDQVGIIHMNGRIYDPTIGRFLQADPMIQDPYNTQSLNRYSYVMNNPLSYSDPSGYARLRKGWWRMPVAIAISVYTAGASSALLGASSSFSAAAAATSGLGGVSSFFASVASAFQTQALITTVVGGALSGAVATGTLKGAVKGGVFAAVTFGIGHGAAGGASPFSDSGRFFAHAAAAGISAEVDGGKFGHGFAASYISIGADKLGLANIKESSGRIIANAIVAGTISEVTGGKFANGAMSAAFRTAYNDGLEIRFKQRMASKLSAERGTEFIDEYRSLNVLGNIEFDSESLFQAGVGLGDGMTLGFTKWLRGSTGVDGGVDTSSTAYSVGNYSSFGVGAARLTYAGLAKGYTMLPGITAQSAVGFRNSLKTGFRLGVGKNWRSKSYEFLKASGKTDSQIISSAGRTSTGMNIYGGCLALQCGSDE